MIKMTFQHTPEQIEILKLHWIQLFETLLREKRTENYNNDLLKTALENEQDKMVLEEQPYSKEEKEKLEKFERKMNVIVSHGNILEQKDILL